MTRLKNSEVNEFKRTMRLREKDEKTNMTEIFKRKDRRSIEKEKMSSREENRFRIKFKLTYMQRTRKR